MRALVCNSGCANACTGERGERDARATARQAAALLELAPSQVVVASTGVIGVPLPIDRVQRGLERAVAQLDFGGKAAYDAAEAIMTTDRVPKLAAYAFYHDDRKYVVGGIAKGSGMIAPNMATMLAFIATDFPLSRAALARGAARSVRRELQHDLGRRRHVDQRRGLCVRAGAARRRGGAGRLRAGAARASASISRARWSPTAKARPRRSRFG